MSPRGDKLRKVLGATLPPVRRVQVLDSELVQAFVDRGVAYLEPQEAAVLVNTARTVVKGVEPSAAIALLAAGAAIESVVHVVVEQCGVPPDPEKPFDALPGWALALFKALGVIPRPATVEDPNAPPKPIETIGELEQRAAAAGIVLR